MGYVYYFENADKEIIYVGHTKNIHTRMNTHFGSNGHLERACYDETQLVYYAELNTLNEARMYEIYYISKLQPKYNQMMNNGGSVSIELPQIDFQLYDIDKCTLALKNELIEHHKELLYSKLNGLIQDIRLSNHSMNVFCQIDLESLSKKTRLTPTDEDRIISRNNLIELHTRNIYEAIERIEKILSPVESNDLQKFVI